MAGTKDGTIFYDNTRNKWRAGISTPGGRRLYKRFATKEQANAWLSEQLNDINKGMFVEPSDITLGEWLLLWLEKYIAGTVKQRTAERYSELAAHTFSLANVKIQKLHPLQVQGLYTEMENKVSSSTTNKLHKLLSAAIKKAHELELVNKNIMTKVKAPRIEKKEIKIFTQEEITTILSYIKSNRYYSKYYSFFLLAVTTGARLGELLGLRIMDVYLDKSEIHIRQSVQESRHGIIFESPKTKSSIRRISIPVETTIALKKTIGNRENGLVFITSNETPISPRNTGRMWNRILSGAGIEYKNFHVLRHTHATQLLTCVPIVEVARRLGHARVSHTLDLYGQAIPNADKGIADNISSLFNLSAL